MAEVPIVSVKTITYNQESYIRDCIEGVLNQRTNFKFEFIIGDDCSTDGTKEIALEYAEKYPNIIKIITAEKNTGSMQNYIRTTLVCSGKYQALCDGDDFWLDPLKLQKQYDFMENNPECSLCFHAVKIIKSNPNRPSYIYQPKRKPKDRFYTIKDIFLTCGNLAPMPSIFFRASAIPTLPDYFENGGSGHLLILLLAASHGSIGYIDEPLGAYRVKSLNSWSMQNKDYKWTMRYRDRLCLMLDNFNKQTNFKYDDLIQKRKKIFDIEAFIRLVIKTKKFEDINILLKNLNLISLKDLFLYISYFRYYTYL